MKEPVFIRPEWGVPHGVHAASSTRRGGGSEGAYTSFNLGLHVGDDIEVVQENRAQLSRSLNLPGTPFWLEQVHAAQVIDADGWQGAEPPVADAAITRTPGTVLAIMTADCLPIIVYSPSAQCIAAIHGGWRSLASGVIENTLAAIGADTGEAQVWLGPAIGADKFEVGDEVWDRFVAKDWGMGRCFNVCENQKYLADLPQIARRILQREGVTHIHGGTWCTHSDPKSFFSYRRDGSTGRMATLVWMTPT